MNDTEQHEVAAAVKEKERDLMGAINLYLRANIPIRAARLVTNNRELIHNQELVNKIAATLIKSELYENVLQIIVLFFYYSIFIFGLKGWWIIWKNKRWS